MDDNFISIDNLITPDFAPLSPWEFAVPLRIPGDAPEPVVAMLLEHARRIEASDMYFVVNEDDVEVQVRHLGVVRPLAVLSREAGQRCIVHVRAMSVFASTSTATQRMAAGYFGLPAAASSTSASILSPTLYGDCLAMRLLERDSKQCRLESLGLVGPQLGTLVSALYSPSGLILVIGPTGNGKTTTLYACLHQLHDGTRKIHTLEDPIEYAVHGLHQTQVDVGVSADFQQMLRGVLRQGPDVLLIGEVRDLATAETTIRGRQQRSACVCLAPRASSGSGPAEHVGPRGLRLSYESQLPIFTDLLRLAS